MKLAVAHQPRFVLQQVNTNTSMSLSKMIVQPSTIYQIFSVGRPILEYEERQVLIIHILECSQSTKDALVRQLYLEDG